MIASKLSADKFGESIKFGFLFILIRVVNGLQAKLKVAPVFSDNMVLQRDEAIPLRGMTKNLKVVTVNFDGMEYKTRVTNTFRTDQFEPNAER